MTVAVNILPPFVCFYFVAAATVVVAIGLANTKMAFFLKGFLAALIDFAVVIFCNGFFSSELGLDLQAFASDSRVTWHHFIIIL